MHGLRKINPVIAGEDAGIIVFEFDNAATGLFDGNRLNDHVASNPRRTMGEMWLEGSGRRAAPRRPSAPVVGSRTSSRKSSTSMTAGPVDTFGGGACEWLQRHVVRHFKEGALLENTARDYLVNLRVQEAVYRSAATGQRIEIASFNPLQPDAVPARRSTFCLTAIPPETLIP